MNFGLDGKRILVLGGGLGIGEATVRLIAAEGAHVAVVDRELERAKAVADAVTARGGTAAAFCIDVLDDDALVAGIAQIERDFGPLDGMATVIGMAAWGSLIDIDMATWDADQNRNLRYFFLAAREVARSMMTRRVGGSIVCVGSVNGIRSAPNHGAYGAAKAGLINLVATMATEWSPFGIRVNVVAPGPIVTPRIPHTGEEGERKMMVNVPMHRRGSVEDIAKAIAFFLSDLSPYITGQTLAVDGGSLATNPFIPLADGHVPA
ncbi:SDR family NAD(P)-dependent oxidoreductase [Sphingomonas psychrolutea]|uniref:Oxidoreductase n=1 Tax=Sphingomonas psychrolutea TaxID=1259676 RepID=A0ABQ1G527_9SPHN|nr:SDR family NAD(P)-dependent oxidoreductase [Sphingomonas psychrolutea]GGA36978.1 oxidoreductase [Sphingomonas psychrolutea]